MYMCNLSSITYVWFRGQGYMSLGLWCLTPLSTIFQLYRGSQFYWWRKSWRSVLLVEEIGGFFFVPEVTS